MWKFVLPFVAVLLSADLGSMMMTGGFRDLDVHDAGALNALNFAVTEHNRRTNDMYLSQVAEVVRVQAQVVAGMNYVITVKMAKTPCRKDRANEVCAIHEDPAKARPYECKFTVWSRPWIGDIQLTNEKC